MLAKTYLAEAYPYDAAMVGEMGRLNQYEDVHVLKWSLTTLKYADACLY
jgi:hypothetical protein